jgi:hypothetical protein
MADRFFEESRKILQEIRHYKDKDINEACLALDHAIKIYSDVLLKDIPERMSLTNYDGDIIHTLINRSGKPETVTIGPEKPEKQDNYIIIGTMIILFGIILFYKLKQ